MLKLRKQPGQSFLEYILLVTLILGALLTMQKYLARGFTGRWKDIGDSIGQEHLYDPQTTTSCAYDYRYYNKWYSVNAFEANGCAELCFSDTYFSDTDRSAECACCIWRSQLFPQCEDRSFSPIGSCP